MVGREYFINSPLFINILQSDPQDCPQAMLEGREANTPIVSQPGNDYFVTSQLPCLLTSEDI